MSNLRALHNLVSPCRTRIRIRNEAAPPRQNPQFEAEGLRAEFIGQSVRIHSLSSEAGQCLNTLVGVIRCIDEKTGRAGVAIDKVGMKLIRFDNLELFSAPNRKSCAHGKSL